MVPVSQSSFWSNVIEATSSSFAELAFRSRPASPVFSDWPSASWRRLGPVREAGDSHLRHSFCSHLAMRGAPARAIQELAGHQDLGTTQRYMHLSPAALDAAIRLLEAGTETSRAVMEK
jgi:integrase